SSRARPAAHLGIALATIGGMIIWLLGLVSWLLIGALVGVAASFTLPGRAKPHPASALLIGMLGGFVGGLASTFLGFGGLASFDPRSLLVATAAACVAIVWWRVAKLTPVGE
ncbi:MAG: hypothetical protein AAF725_17795, partial [Acidobacteriota bacterium]